MGQYYKIVILDGTILRVWIEPFGSKLMEHSYINDIILKLVESIISPSGIFYKSKIIWAGDYADAEEGTDINLYRMTENEEFKMYNNKYIETNHRYIVNYTKKVYVDKSKSTEIHPLPLLVSEGNGKGGGDYFGKNKELCGSWARDIISMEQLYPVDFKELICDFDFID